MKINIIEKLKSGKIILWEYDFKELDYSPAISSTKQQVPSKLWLGLEQGVHYYGFLYKKNRYIIACDNRNKKEIITRICNLETNKTEDIIMDDWVVIKEKSVIKNANSTIKKYHNIQKYFPKEWIALSIFLVIAIVVFSIKTDKVNYLAILATNVSVIIALEDVMNLYAKRFYKKISIIIINSCRIFRGLYCLLSIIELVTMIIGQYDVVSVIGAIFTVIGAAIVIGELLIRKDSFSKL